MKTDGERIGDRVQRPWGAWTLLEAGTGYKVKRIEVRPGKRLSLQKHFCRSEHWVIVQGIARVTNGDRVFSLETNQWTFIPLGAVHRLENPDAGPLVVIEVQNGNDLRETDIVRLEDDFGRLETDGSQEPRAKSQGSRRTRLRFALRP
ncbi:MAG: phosphomannose isomerase type II C-terminal cupin domain [Candidatus Methylomirabilales bacterium]